MLSVIDPSADAIWESVATIITYEGTEERRPRTDEDWEPLRHDAVRLVEATNLLLMADREVARSGFQSENPGIELEPSEIRALIDEDWDTWERMVRDLYDASMIMLEAVDAKDADMLFDNGGRWTRRARRVISTTGIRRTLCRRPAPCPTRRPRVPERSRARRPPRRDDRRPCPPERKAPWQCGDPVGVDPRCAEINAGKVPVQETVLAERDGSLATSSCGCAGCSRTCRSRTSRS